MVKRGRPAVSSGGKRRDSAGAPEALVATAWWRGSARAGLLVSVREECESFESVMEADLIGWNHV